MTGSSAQGRWEALVLAAGAGARFGGAKLLAPWRGGPLIEAALGAAFAAPARGVTVVTGAWAEGVGAAAAGFVARTRQGERLRCVHAADHGLGLSASLKAGLAALPGDCAGAMIFLGDMPLVPPDLAGTMLAALPEGAAAAAPVFEGRRGHPVLLRRALFPALAGLEGDAGAGRVLAGLGEGLMLWPVGDAGVLRDIDRPGDLEAADRNAPASLTDRTPYKPGR
ncbi:MAG: NTP transferase domain-containing protein [Caulobacter sp.]